MSDTPEMRLFAELLGDREFPRAEAADFLVAIDFDGWVVVRKSALRKLCRAGDVDYDDFDPTDGGRS